MHERLQKVLKIFIFITNSSSTTVKWGATKAIHRKIHESKGSFELREDQIPYTATFGTENERLRQENTYEWDPF